MNIENKDNFNTEENVEDENIDGKRLSESEERNWATFLWLSTILGYLTLIGFIAPIVIWLLKKDESEFVDENGKEVLNLLISYTLYLFIASLTMIILIGFILAPIVSIIPFVLVIIGGLKSSNGEVYKSFGTIRFVK